MQLSSDLPTPLQGSGQGGDTGHSRPVVISSLHRAPKSVKVPTCAPWQHLPHLCHPVSLPTS